MAIKTKSRKRKRPKRRKGPTRLEVGDVVQSPAFANRECRDPEDSNEPWKVNDKPDFFSGTSKMRAWAKRKFVVLRVAYEGGGTGMGPHDVYPDGWHVFARLLRHDGTYSPGAPSIEFYQTGCFTCMVTKFTVVGKMQMVFVPVED